MWCFVRRPCWHRMVFLAVCCLLGLGATAGTIPAENAVLDPVEITNDEYRRFLHATGHPEPEHWRDGTFAQGMGQEPVTLVTWHDAVAYCHWAGGKRLPTVAEWLAVCTNHKLQKRGDIWEWTSTEVGGGEGSFKALCGPMGICDCSHEYRPHWKNEVKGFRCIRDPFPVAGNAVPRMRVRRTCFGVRRGGSLGT